MMKMRNLITFLMNDHKNILKKNPSDINIRGISDNSHGSGAVQKTYCSNFVYERDYGILLGKVVDGIDKGNIEAEMLPDVITMGYEVNRAISTGIVTPKSIKAENELAHFKVILC